MTEFHFICNLFRHVSIFLTLYLKGNWNRWISFLFVSISYLQLRTESLQISKTNNKSNISAQQCELLSGLMGRLLKKTCLFPHLCTVLYCTVCWNLIWRIRQGLMFRLLECFTASQTKSKHKQTVLLLLIILSLLSGCWYYLRVVQWIWIWER